MAPELSQTLETVVPRFYVALPNAGDADLTLAVEDSPVERLLAADLVVFYAFDLGTHYQIVANRDLPKLKVTKDELHERAIQNLRDLDLEVRAHKGDRIFMLTAGGNYEATLLLLPEVWASIAEMVEGDIVTSIPARDILYVTGNADAENLADMRRWTSKMLEQADKPLSRAFLRWNGENWEEYAGFAA